MYITIGSEDMDIEKQTIMNYLKMEVQQKTR